jgi:CRISPR-associated protein Cas1
MWVAVMKLLFVEHENTELRFERSALLIYQNGERVTSVPIDSLERIIVAPYVVLSAGVLGFIASHQVGLLVVNCRYPDRTAMLSGMMQTDVERRVKQYKLLDNADFRLHWSTQIVLAKTLRQYKFLYKAMSIRPDLRHDLMHATEQLNATLLNLKTKNSVSLASLRGMEGAASACYFNAYAKLFPEQLNFTHRNRRPPADPVNACLSLSYTLIHHEAVTALRIVGLDPAVGCYHELYYNRESLACDLIEAVRPLMDAWIWELFHHCLRAEHFTTNDGACYLNKAGKQHFYEAYYQKVLSLRKILRRYAQTAVKAVINAH